MFVLLGVPPFPLNVKVYVLSYTVYFIFLVVGFGFDPSEFAFTFSSVASLLVTTLAVEKPVNL